LSRIKIGSKVLWIIAEQSLIGLQGSSHPGSIRIDHAERLIHTLLPLNEDYREDIAKVRGELLLVLERPEIPPAYQRQRARYP
jgi:hypothetical protein